MSKIKINVVDGKPAVSAVTLAGLDGAGLSNGKLKPGETVDVADLEPYQGLIDRNILVTVAGRPKARKGDATATDPDTN